MTAALETLRRLQKQEAGRPKPEAPTLARLVSWLLLELQAAPEDPRWKTLGVEDPVRYYRDLAERAHRAGGIEEELLRLWRTFGTQGPQRTKGVRS